MALPDPGGGPDDEADIDDAGGNALADETLVPTRQPRARPLAGPVRLARRHPGTFRGAEDVRAHVLNVLDNADAALDQTARKTITLVHRTNRGLLILEAVPRGGRYFIMK